jgi:dihydrolipoamide dehydrogenase
LTEVPKSLVIIGGGVIGLEFATLYNEFGAKVTIIEGLPRILPPCDAEISAMATQIAKDAGISIITNAKVIGYENNEIKYELDGKEQSIPCDKVLESVGRRTNIDAIGNIGIQLGKRKEIIVNEKMQTNIPHILAIGDVVGQAMLAHVAYRHGKIAINTILNIDDKYDQHLMPASIYTYPEISMIGRTEEQLKEEKIDYLKIKVPNYILGKSIADGSTVGFTKLLFGKKYGEILGCHMINCSSSDIIAEVAAFMTMEATIFDIDKTVHPHPSISETIAEAAIRAVFL